MWEDCARGRFDDELFELAWAVGFREIQDVIGDSLEQDAGKELYHCNICLRRYVICALLLGVV